MGCSVLWQKNLKLPRLTASNSGTKGLHGDLRLIFAPSHRAAVETGSDALPRLKSFVPARRPWHSYSPLLCRVKVPRFNRALAGAQICEQQVLDNGIVLSPVAFGAVRKRPGLQEGPQRREK